MKKKSYSIIFNDAMLDEFFVDADIFLAKKI